MPWTTKDVDEFKKGLTAKQKRQWVAIANSALAKCQDEGGKDCEAKAIRQANGAVEEAMEAQEAITIKAQAKQALRATKTLLASKGLPEYLKKALDDVEAALKKTWADLEAEVEPEPEGEPEEKPAEESVDQEIIGDVISLVERAVRPDNTVTVKVIEPGWGSSGYYPPDVLARDGKAVFTKGVKMFWDHATAKEEAERPEGKLDLLAGELITDAAWQDKGPAGAGLYADAKVFGRFKDAVSELAPHIGVSIRAMGKAKEGEADGKKGRVINALTAAKSVDFVTMPGAGGKVIELFEAARKPPERIDEVTKEEAERLQTENASLKERVRELSEENAKLTGTLLAKEAAEFTRETLAAMNMPEPTRQRLYEQLSSKPILKDGALDAEEYRAVIEAAAKAEIAYLDNLRGAGEIRGMGSTPVKSGADTLYESFRDMWVKLGKSAEEADKLAKIAATGR